MPSSVGIIIGRFQVPVLHAGHFGLLAHVRARHSKYCVFVGKAGMLGPKNPLPAELVTEMIRSAFAPDMAAGRLQIHTLQDIPEQDLQWSLNLDKFIGLLYPDQQVTLYSGRNGFAGHYFGRYRPVEEYTVDHTEYSGSAIREHVVNNPMHTPEFRAGVIYGVTHYTTSWMTYLYPDSYKLAYPDPETTNVSS